MAAVGLQVTHVPPWWGKVLRGLAWLALGTPSVLSKPAPCTVGVAGGDTVEPSVAVPPPTPASLGLSSPGAAEASSHHRQAVWVWGQGVGLRDWGLDPGSPIWDLEFGVWGRNVLGSESWDCGPGLRIPHLEFGPPGFKSDVPGSGSGKSAT